MKIRNLAIGALALVLPLSAAACGGKDDNNSGKRPSVAELKASFKKAAGSAADSIPNFDEAATCVAEKMHASDLPNGVLRSEVKGEKAEVDKDNLKKYEKIYDDIEKECLGSMTGS